MELPVTETFRRSAGAFHIQSSLMLKNIFKQSPFSHLPRILSPKMILLRVNKLHRRPLFLPFAQWHNASIADAILSRTFKIPQPLRPLAFERPLIPPSGSPFALWNECTLQLTHFGADFTSDADFLERMARLGGIIDLQGPTEELPRDDEQIYARIDAEQQRL
ncbi:hypothetical protein C8R43DRAFT_1002939, partial [Mycena crocata]